MTRFKGSHISDRDLMMASDGELSGRQDARVRRHLAACWQCRTRMKDLEDSIVEFMRAEGSGLYAQLPPLSSSRLRFQARLRELAQESQINSGWRRPAYAGAALAFVLIIGMLALYSGGLFEVFRSDNANLLPDPTLTPGATRVVSTTELCSPESAGTARSIPTRLGQRVFDEYGIREPGPRSYELDYLIDRELGGSDDVQNLWPQPYSAVWSARVKDALEEHLYEMVCAGQLALPTAQHDLSTDWIATYKKYFHTDSPVVGHVAFIKDEPWKN